MAVSKDNVRVAITISKELKNKLEIIAKDEQRSFSNICSKFLSDCVKSRKVLKNENSNIKLLLSFFIFCIIQILYNYSFPKIASNSSASIFSFSKRIPAT